MLADLDPIHSHTLEDPECIHCESGSVGSASPAPSLYSISSSRDGHILRELHGRTLNALCETYALPADEEEFSRLNRQHEVWKLQFHGALCICQQTLDHVLEQPQSSDAVRKAVLDLGSGSGSWLQDMAVKYPWVDFTGIDLAPQTRGQNHHALPDNVTLEIDDVNLGLTHWKDQFDVVHARGLATGVHDYNKLLQEIHEILRPGGLLLSSEPDLELFRDSGDVLEPAFEENSSGSWIARCLFEAYQSFRRRGASMEAGLMHERWLHNIPGYTDIIIQKMYNPIGPWMAGDDENETRRLRTVGVLTQLNTIDTINSLRPLLLADGFFEDRIDVILERARHEIGADNMRQNGLRLFTKWHCAAARKL